MSDSLKILLICAVIVVVSVSLGAVLDGASCNAKWADSGRKHDWSLLGGCRVADKEGRLIPANNVRDMQ